MAQVTRIRKIGNSYGIILNRRLLDALGVGENDKLYPVKLADGIKLTPYDPDFEQAMESNRDYMRRHRNALRKLASR